MKVTKAWLKKHEACKEGIQAFCSQKETDSTKILKSLIESNEKGKLEWANWLICRVFNGKQKTVYAVYAAKLVLPIFEKEHPDDLRPRKAIEATERCLKNPSKKNRKEAADAARAVARAAWAASAAYASAWAADAAAAAASAVYATSAATWAADAAAWASWAARAADYNKTMIQILEYGITLLK